jgi:hypothetical protein
MKSKWATKRLRVTIHNLPSTGSEPLPLQLGWWNGRHVRLRGVCRKACGFKSRPEHQDLAQQMSLGGIIVRFHKRPELARNSLKQTEDQQLMDHVLCIRRGINLSGENGSVRNRVDTLLPREEPTGNRTSRSAQGVSTVNPKMTPLCAGLSRDLHRHCEHVSSGRRTESEGSRSAANDAERILDEEREILSRDDGFL